MPPRSNLEAYAGSTAGTIAPELKEVLKGDHMSRIVKAQELRRGDMFEMPNGSVFVTSGRGDAPGAQRGRLWCAHAPDAVTFDPPLTELPTGQMVRLLSGDEMDTHYSHAGYVETVFRHEMDRRHREMMLTLNDKKRREAEEQQRQQARRPWWSKLLG